MSDDYSEDHAHHDYRAIIDMHAITGETMTDAGVPVRDLCPIGDASLTPGDPSPVGRTEDGDLAYPLLPDVTYMRLERAEAARLARLWANAHGITEPPAYPLESGSPDVLLASLFEEALPQAFYAEANHGKIARENDIRSILEGDFDRIAHRWEKR